MKKRTNLWILAAILTAACLMLSACGSSYKSSYNSGMKGEYAATESPAMPAPEVSYDDYGFDYPAASESESAAGYLGSQPNLVNKADVKLIYTANLSLQTTEFDACIAGIRTMVEEQGGYFENVNTSNGGYYDYSYGYNRRYASFTIRVPAGNYTKLLSSIGSQYHVTDQNESVQDIGQAYAETEGHLKTLRIKRDRLQELLAEAVDMQDIITLESALSDTEYEIERYSNQLNNYNSLIGYSTIYLNVSEVIRETDIMAEDPSFGARISAAFVNACTDFADNAEDFVLWIVENIFNLILWAVIIILLILFHPLARLRAFSRRRLEKMEAARSEKKKARHGAQEQTAPAPENSEDHPDE